MNKKITIHDIARIMNIDSSTVSRALSDSPRVGKKTKQLVKETAEKLGYQRNLLASNLRTNKTNTIGVVIPFISRFFFSNAIDGIEQIASKNNYRVIIAQTHEDLEKEIEIVNGLYMNRIDGLIISPSLNTRNDEHLQKYTNNGIPVVIFDRFIKESNLPKVILEDRVAAYNLTEHLINNGYKRIFHVAGNLDFELYKERSLGYKEALKVNNIGFDKSMVKSIELFEEEAVNLVKEIFNSKKDIPDAFLCANDITAIAIMKYINEESDYNVPDDIAVVGFSNEPSSALIKPGLTTVNQNSNKMGKTSSQLLIDLIKSEDAKLDSSETVVIESGLIIRESSKAKK